MPPAFADSLLFTLAGTLRRSARAVGTGRSLGAARIPVARLELGPLGPPGHQLQVDVKFIEPLGQTGRRRKYYQFTAIDDCTRLRVLRAYPRCDQKTAIAFVDDVMAKLPFAVERVQTDNGSEFGASFHWHLLDKGIDQVRIKPRTPRLNGKVERSHPIDSEEFYRLLQGQVIDDTRLFAEKLQEWEDYYNYHRPPGALSGQTPYERLRQKPKTRCHEPSSAAHGGQRLDSLTPRSAGTCLWVSNDRG